MKNHILKIILKNRENRSIWELLSLTKFYQNCSTQEFKYAMGLEFVFRNE